jgi:hypothetical protein
MLRYRHISFSGEHDTFSQNSFWHPETIHISDMHATAEMT